MTDTAPFVKEYRNDPEGFVSMLYQRLDGSVPRDEVKADVERAVATAEYMATLPAKSKSLKTVEGQLAAFALQYATPDGQLLADRLTWHEGDVEVEQQLGHGAAPADKLAADYLTAQELEDAGLEDLPPSGGGSL